MAMTADNQDKEIREKISKILCDLYTDEKYWSEVDPTGYMFLITTILNPYFDEASKRIEAVVRESQLALLKNLRKFMLDSYQGKLTRPRGGRGFTEGYDASIEVLDEFNKRLTKEENRETKENENH